MCRGAVTHKCLKDGSLSVSVTVNSRWNRPLHDWIRGSHDISKCLCPSVPCTCCATPLPHPDVSRLPRLASFSGQLPGGPGCFGLAPSLQGCPGDRWSLHGISHRVSALVLRVWLKSPSLSWLLWPEQGPCPSVGRRAGSASWAERGMGSFLKEDRGATCYLEEGWRLGQREQPSPAPFFSGFLAFSLSVPTCLLVKPVFLGGKTQLQQSIMRSVDRLPPLPGSQPSPKGASEAGGLSRARRNDMMSVPGCGATSDLLRCCFVCSLSCQAVVVAVLRCEALC